MSTKVFISDIHLTDTSTGNHNISLQTLQEFFGDIKKDVEDTGGMDKLELIILGDFIDVIRSTKWKGTIQPWGDLQVIKPIVKDIIDTVIIKNQSIFNELKKYVNEEGIKISYIMGNHDRLINSPNYDDTRATIRNASGIASINDKGETFPWRYYDDELPIYAVHGNDFDVYNTTINTASPTSGTVTPIGDAVVTLLINQYPERVYKIQNNVDAYKRLQEIDNLRPSTIVPFWIYHLAQKNNELKDLLIEQWNILLEEFSSNNFVEDWSTKNWKGYFELKNALNCLTSTSAEKLYELFGSFIKKDDTYLVNASELIEKQKCDYVLFGHTHESGVSLLDVEGEKEKYYINTGTWRKRVVPGKNKNKDIIFGNLESMDYVIFTIDDSVSEQKIKSFQLWDGTVRKGIA